MMTPIFPLFLPAGGLGEWSSIGVKSPIPHKHRDDLNLPTIQAGGGGGGGLGADLNVSNQRSRAPSIELYPTPGVRTQKGIEKRRMGVEKLFKSG